MKQIFKRKYLMVFRDVDYDVGIKISVYPYLRLFITLPTIEIRMGIPVKKVWVYLRSFFPKKEKNVIFSRKECVWQYCPTPKKCKNKCQASAIKFKTDKNLEW